MVKRKYLALLVFIFDIYPISSLATPYLPESGHYKYIGSILFTDKSSRAKRRERTKLFRDIQNIISKLSLQKAWIYEEFKRNQENNPNLSLPNSKKRLIESIDKDIAALEAESKKISSFGEDKICNLEVEYGIYKNQSVGFRVEYNQHKFPQVKPEIVKHNAKIHAKNVDVFYKYQIFKNHNWVVALQPKFHYSKHNTHYQYYLNFATLVGYSHRAVKKKYTKFYETSISIRSYFGKNLVGRTGYAVSILEGVHFDNGLIFSHFTEYEQSKQENYLYSKTIYDQFSVAKEFYFDNLKLKSFTAQIGYFCKVSTLNPKYKISGPILSLWCDL